MTHPRPGLYRHYKGGLYTLLATARHSETEEWHAVYRSEAEGTLWIRPLVVWSERVDGVPRFALQTAPGDASADGSPAPLGLQVRSGAEP